MSNVPSPLSPENPANPVPKIPRDSGLVKSRIPTTGFGISTGLSMYHAPAFMLFSNIGESFGPNREGEAIFALFVKL